LSAGTDEKNFDGGHPDDQWAQLQAELQAATAKIANLEVALLETRRIAMAIGIVMERRRITEPAALEYLRALSNRSQRRMSQLAADIVMTGVLEE
jgi:AmiR/NasT family two-component response regulator